ncbi:MAG: phosphoribosylanthranilate isomerase [Thermaerobacter sp.]|nr:phosphoribosylanthranilate isomerase [Thermaerobacter sp.]
MTGPVAIKICGLGSSEEAGWALEAGADFVGAMLAVSPRRVSFEVAAGMARTFPGRVVAVVRGVPDPLWNQLWAVPWGGLQVYDRPVAAWIARAQAQGALAIEPVATRGSTESDVWLWDGPVPGSGQTWTRPGVSRPDHRLWVAGGLTPANVGTVLTRWRPDGVDVSSGVEHAGVKSRTLIQQFVQEVRRWEQTRHTPSE